MFKKISWNILLFISGLISLIFLVGFCFAFAITTNSPSKKSEVAPTKSQKSEVSNSAFYNILVMGDSLAKGTGDEKGRGFAIDFSNSWSAKTHKEIKINNLAVNGDVSSDLLKIIEQEQTLSYIKSSNIIFLSIGGNEINRLSKDNVSFQTSNIKSIEDTYLKNLKNIFKIIRTQNSKCLIIFIGLYNPFGNAITPEKINFLNDWNYQTQQLISLDSSSLFIPTYDLFKYNIDNYLSIDNFHPNSLGYQAISDRIIDSLKNYEVTN